MGVKMACFCVISSNGFLISQEKLRIHVGKAKSLWENKGLHSSFSSLNYTCNKSQYGLLWNNTLVSYSGFQNCRKSVHKLFCKNEIRSLVSRNKRAHVTERKTNGVRRKFSLRLRPRWRLLCARFRKFSIRSMLNDVGTFVRNNVKKLAFSALITIALGLCYLFLKLTSIPSPKLVPYSDLITSIEKGSVDKVLIEEGSRRIYYNINSQTLENLEKINDESSLNDVPSDNVVDIVEGKDGKNVFKKFSRSRPATPAWQFSARKIDHDEKFLLSLMREKGTSYSSAPQSAIASIRSVLLTILTLWIPLTPLMWILYRQLSAANSPGKKRKPNTQMVSFDDVEGVDAAKIELMEIVMCMQGSINYKKLGAKLPGGVLLVGPPGTGKTLLARAVAGEAGVPFFSVSASEFVEMFVGRGAARIRDLFSVARKYSPSIIFIDELDAVGGKRGKSFNDERDQTLNQLLTEMDGFESDMKVVVIAATNRPESLDPALCRPGRFSRKVTVGEPDEDGRRKILAVHLRGIPLEEDTRLICNLIASFTPRFVGADLANIVNEAALLAARRGSETVTREDIMEAIERAKFGINDKRVSPDRISKELGRLFPWMKPLIEKNDTRLDGGLEGPLGYQSLS